MTYTTKVRQRRHESAKVARGGRRIPGGVFSPEVARAIDSLLASNYAPSVTGCVSRALVEAAADKEREFFRNAARRICNRTSILDGVD